MGIAGRRASAVVSSARIMSKVYAVIMAGGSGTRFWPASRTRRPKQLLALTGKNDGETLLAATVRRLEPLVPADRVVVVTGEHLAEDTAAVVPYVLPAQILREPAPRNTAPCIAWANALVAKLDPEAVVMVLPSDHFIADEAAFLKVLASAVESAASGRVTTVGIVPTRAETGYGYIEVGDELSGTSRAVKRFVEKPDRARAETFVKEGPSRYLWNAGMFFFRVKDMAALLEKHLPGVAAGVAKMSDPEAIKEIFPTLESISIDHGVMEKAEDLAVVPGDFGWNDIGSWQSAWELAEHDANGNAVGDGNLALEARNNLIRSLAKSPKKIALVGVDDLVVVETDDAILVIPRDRAQDVRLVVEALKKSGETSLL